MTLIKNPCFNKFNPFIYLMMESTYMQRETGEMKQPLIPSKSRLPSYANLPEKENLLSDIFLGSNVWSISA